MGFSVSLPRELGKGLVSTDKSQWLEDTNKRQKVVMGLTYSGNKLSSMGFKLNF